jgi:hypothetical protein
MVKSYKLFAFLVINLAVQIQICAQSIDNMAQVKSAKSDKKTIVIDNPNETKFLHITELGFLLGSQAAINNIYPQYYAADLSSKMAYSSSYYPYYQSNNYNNFTFQHFTGYKVSKAIALGVTGGFDFYRANIITPLSIGMRSTIIPSRRISPIANVDVGYGFVWNNASDKQNKTDKDGGLALNPSVGIRIKVGNDGSQMNINVGYKLQQSKVTNNRPVDQYYMTEYRSFNRLSVRLGLGF